MLDCDSEFEESLLEKAQKQQDLVVMSYDSEGTTKVVAGLNDNVASIFTEIFF
jgi:transketolase C-terminal domain/subunit